MTNDFQAIKAEVEQYLNWNTKRKMSNEELAYGITQIVLSFDTDLDDIQLPESTGGD